MYNINDYVVYKKDVCKVKEIKKGYFNTDCYVLVSIEDESLTINVPIENKLGKIRSIITKEEIEKLINSIPNIKPIKDINDKMLEQEYKKLISEDSYEGLITIIKTTFLNNKERIDNNKKIGARDDAYFKKAEKILYNEFSISLNMTYNETKDYINKRVKEILD